MKKENVTINETTDRLLCKAKRIDNGEWIHGFVYTIWEKAYILWGMTNDKPDMVEVDPDTICLSTGLTGKDDCKIWENDILRFTINGDLLIVRWNEECCGFVLEVKSNCNDPEDVELFRFNDPYVLSKLEVVGNTIDNPELLEW